MSRFKETNFFSSNPNGFTRKSYERLFNRAGTAKAVGEASPSYLYDERAPGAIKEAIPDCKIIIILRNPVERLISDFYYSQSWGSNIDLDLNEFIAACILNPDRKAYGFEPRIMVTKGRYYGQVKKYLRLFSWQNVFLRLYDDLKKDPERMMTDLFEFLEVDPLLPLEIHTVHNGNSVAVFPEFSRLMARTRRLEEILVAPLVPPTMRGRITDSLRAVNRRPSAAAYRGESVRPDDRARIVDMYRVDVQNLESLIERDLQGWLA